MSSQILNIVEAKSSHIDSNVSIPFPKQSAESAQEHSYSEKHKSFDDEMLSMDYDDDENSHPDGSKFPACSYFGDGVHFGMGCVFGAGCVFGKYVRFGSDCIFGTNCRFGINAQFGAGCVFEGKQTFASGTQFGIQSDFWLILSFGPDLELSSDSFSETHSGVFFWLSLRMSNIPIHIFLFILDSPFTSSYYSICQWL